MYRYSKLYFCSITSSFKSKRMFRIAYTMHNLNGAPVGSCSGITRKYSSKYDEKQNLKSLHRHKGIFALCVFSSTLLLTWLLQQRKLKKLTRNLEGCVKIPMEKDLIGTNLSLFRYHKFVFPEQIVMSGVLHELPTFKFNCEDIVVASFPKSGTTWVQEIVYMLTHNLQMSDKSSEVLETRFPYLEYPYPGIKAVSNIPGARLIKTHLPFSLLPESFKLSGAKLIYIVRNPRDVAVSYYHFMKLLTAVNFTGTLDDFINLFLSDKVPYGPYFEHLKSYIQEEKRESVLIITYEDLKANPLSVIKEIADFLTIPVMNSDIYYVAAATSFIAMTGNPSVNYEHWKELGFAHKDKGNFLRKGEVGDWQNYFTNSCILRFAEWENKNIGEVDFGRKFNWNHP